MKRRLRQVLIAATFISRRGVGGNAAARRRLLS